MKKKWEEIADKISANFSINVNRNERVKDTDF